MEFDKALEIIDKGFVNTSFTVTQALNLKLLIQMIRKKSEIMACNFVLDQSILIYGLRMYLSNIWLGFEIEESVYIFRSRFTWAIQKVNCPLMETLGTYTSKKS